MRLFFWGVLCILKQVWLLSENYFEMGLTHYTSVLLIREILSLNIPFCF